MANETINFDPTKVVVGGIRNDTPPTPADGEPCALRVDSTGALMIGASSSSVIKSSDILRTLSGPTICFSDGGTPEAAEALTTSFADSSGDVWIELPTDTRAIGIYVTTSGTAMTALQVMPWQSNDGGVSFSCALECDIDIVDSNLQTGPLYMSVQGQDGAATLPNGTYYLRLTKNQFSSDTTHIKIQGRRSGGDATSALYAQVVFEG